MKILSRYIFLECLGSILVSLCAFTGILLTLRMLKFATLIINKGVAIEQIVWVFVAIIPTFLEIALPLSILLGVMLAIARLSGDSEIIVLRASGVSMVRLFVPVAAVGLLALGVSFYICLVLRPWGFRTLSEKLFEIARAQSTVGLSEGVFNNLGGITLYSESIDNRTGALQRVLIEDRRDPLARKIISAQSGQIISDSRASTISLALTEGAIHESANGNYQFTTFRTNTFALSSDEIYGSQEEGRERRTDELSLNDLTATRDSYASLIRLREEGPLPPMTMIPAARNLPDDILVIPEKDLTRRMHRADIEANRRLSMPVASLLMALLGLPLGILPPRSQRTWGAGLSIAIGLIVFVTYYGMLSLTISAGERGSLSTFLALWLPNIGTALAASFLLGMIGSERWSSLAQGFEYGVAVLQRTRQVVRRLGRA